MTTADTQQLAALSLMMMGISFLVGVGVYVWYAVMFAKVLKRFGQPAWSAWVPVYNEMQLFKIGGQQPWLALLLYVPLVQIIGIVFKVFALHRISQQSWRGIGTTVLGVLLPPVWATVLAFGPSPDPEQGRMPARGTPVGDIPPVAPTGPLAGTAPGAPVPPAPGADGWFLSQPGAAPAPAPIVPPAPAQPSPAPAAQSWPEPAPPAAPAPAVPAASAVAAPVAPASSPEQGAIGTTGGSSALASLFAPPSDAPPAAQAEPPARIPGRIEPLPPVPVTPPPAAPSAAAAAPAAAAQAAVAPAAPSPAAPLPSLPVAPPPGFAAPAAPVAQASAAAAPIAGYDPADAETIVTGDGEDDPFDRTVVVTRRPVVPWRLVLDDGTSLALDAVVVVLGRNPREALTGEQRLVVPDPSRTLSKTHAVLRLEGEQWAITDLDSTNGVMVPDSSGVDQLVDAGVPTPVRDRFVLGTLGVRLERVGETPGGR